jgi:hypothetical protein
LGLTGRSMTLCQKVALAWSGVSGSPKIDQLLVLRPLYEEGA